MRKKRVKKERVTLKSMKGLIEFKNSVIKGMEEEATVRQGALREQRDRAERAEKNYASEKQYVKELKDIAAGQDKTIARLQGYLDRVYDSERPPKDDLYPIGVATMKQPYGQEERGNDHINSLRSHDGGPDGYASKFNYIATSSERRREKRWYDY